MWQEQRLQQRTANSSEQPPSNMFMINYFRNKMMTRRVAELSEQTSELGTHAAWHQLVVALQDACKWVNQPASRQAYPHELRCHKVLYNSCLGRWCAVFDAIVIRFVVFVGVADVANANMSNIYMRMLIYGSFSVVGPSNFASCKLQLHQGEVLKMNSIGRKSREGYRWTWNVAPCCGKQKLAKTNKVGEEDTSWQLTLVTETAKKGRVQFN